MIQDEEGVLHPKKSRRDPRAAPDVVMVLVRSQLDRLTAGIAARKMAFSEAHLYNFYEATLSGGGLFSICGPFFGAPHAVVGIEKLIALGAERIWVLGWCGALDPNLSIGDIVIPSKAFSEEGTSALYTRGLVEPAADPRSRARYGQRTGFTGKHLPKSGPIGRWGRWPSKWNFLR
jgi:uridine phosphorylase